MSIPNIKQVIKPYLGVKFTNFIPTSNPYVLIIDVSDESLQPTSTVRLSNKTLYNTAIV